MTFVTYVGKMIGFHHILSHDLCHKCMASQEILVVLYWVIVTYILCDNDINTFLPPEDKKVRMGECEVKYSVHF